VATADTNFCSLKENETNLTASPVILSPPQWRVFYFPDDAVYNFVIKKDGFPSKHQTA
jgi:hypothetical protein